MHVRVMFRSCRALSPCQSSGSGGNNDDSTKSNSMSTKIEKSLQDWTLPPCSASSISKRSGLFNFFCSPDPTVKTMEKEIRLSDGYSSFSLFTENLQRVYPSQMCVLYVGKIQVALKPTKLGSNISAVICLRDKRHQKFHESLLGMVDSSLCDGPIYFSFSPTYCVSLYQPRSSIDAFSIDVKIQGSGSSTSVPAGDGNVILMYRFHYNVRRSNSLLRSTSGAVVGEKETTLFVTNVARGNRVVSRKVYWDQVSVPERWLGENKPPSSSSAGKQGEVARIDLKVAAEAYVLKVEVPGFKKEEVKVEVEAGRSLVISGERSNEEEDEGDEEDEEVRDGWRCMEKSSGKFLRRFKLPENANSGEVTAAMENGVLTVTMPKGEVDDESEVKTIPISG